MNTKEIDPDSRRISVHQPPSCPPCNGNCDQGRKCPAQAALKQRNRDVYRLLEQAEKRLDEQYLMGYRAGVDHANMTGIHTCGPKCKRPACIARREAVEAEREACARALESMGRHFEADAIRARGQA